MLDQVSIIIPLAPDETKHKTLLKDLEHINTEIIPVSGRGRAGNMNIGATRAQRRFLWFLHADSVVTQDNLQALEESLKEKPDDLHYFDLRFDGPFFMRFNGWGANLRSWIFGVPYGDQGFCISKEMFEKAGGYREDLPYAEDLMFVWQVRHAGIKLKRVRSCLLTSARKYREKGWFKLTWVYQVIWIRLSLPEALKLIKARIKS